MFSFGPCTHDAYILFLFPVILLGIRTCSLDLAARSLLLLLCCPLTDIHCSIFISRWLMLAAIPILRCSLLAYPRSLLTDYCSLSLLAADFSLLAGLYSLHAAHCHTYAKSAKKIKGRPTRQLKILKNSKTKKSTQCRQRKKKVSFNKKSHSFYEKKKSAVCRQISKNQRKWFVRKQVGQKSAITRATSAYVYSLHF